MAFDFTSEAIAHFIGSFKQITEEPRLRTDHDPFDSPGPDYDNGNGLNTITITLSAPMQPEAVDTGISYRIELLPLPERFTPVSVYVQTGVDTGSPFVMGGDPVAPQSVPGWVPFGFSAQLYVAPPPPPPSYATVVYQHNLLTDSDRILSPGAGELLPQEAAADALNWLAAEAAGLAGPGIPGIPQTGADIAVTAYEVHAAVTGFAPEATDEAQVATHTGENAAGIHVNGEKSGTAPDLIEVLPVLPEEDDDGGPAHDVIAGGNTLVNEAYVSFSLAEAPVIAVMGNSLSLASISQVSVISDLDTLNGMMRGAGSTDNMISNVASLLTTSSEPQSDDDARDDSGEEDGAEEDDAPSFPSIASVVRIDGDVVNFNYLHQQNIVADDDVVSTELTASETYIQSGGNLAVNATSLLELSYIYDLIVVGGDIINVSIINQMNVLLDDDFVTYPEDEAWDVTGSGNVLWNEASINSVGADSYHEMSDGFAALGDSLEAGSDAVPGSRLTHEAFEGQDDVLSVLYVAGDLISLQVVDQVNILSDVDQLDVDAQGDAAAAITGANALINIAAISEYGVDSQIEVGGGVYSDALMHQAGLIVDEDNPLLTQEGGLVTEAVAFLMDDAEQRPEDGDRGSSGYVSGDDMGGDPMGGLLA
jgi:hypothetical protein